MDTMLILEGPQGLKKSTALKVLSNALMPNLFTDDMDKPNSKDAAMQMQGRLIIEISELASLTKTEVEHVKSWLSRTADRFRLPFGKIVQEFPRTCVFAGTHNPIEGVGYLKDPTGARRFWPVRCTNIDIRALQRDGEQLWAEAVHRYNAGEIWWLSSDDEHKTALQAQSSRAEHDPYADMINEFITGRTIASINQIMTALEIPKERRSSMTSKRISGYMGSIGWKAGTEGGRLTFYSPDHRDLYAAE